VATRTETYTITELRELLLPFCENHPIAKLEVFGSIADGTARVGSDVDLMVTFKAGAKLGAEFLDIVLELEDLLAVQWILSIAQASRLWRTGSCAVRFSNLCGPPMPRKTSDKYLLAGD